MNSEVSEKQASNFKLETLQVEITTNCNFECNMCLHAQGSILNQEMSLELFQTIAKVVFPQLKHLILYGVGEPLSHPDFLTILQISRKYLPPAAKLEFTTNGSLLTPEYLDDILSFGVNRIIVSIDSPFLPKLEQLREGFKPEVFHNLKNLAKMYKAGKIEEIAIETVISKENLYDLPFLIDSSAQIGIPQIFFSHLLPFSPLLEKHSLFINISEKAYHILDEIGQIGWNILDQLILTPKYHKILNAEQHSQIKQMQQIVANLQNENFELDLRKINEVQFKKPAIEESRRMFDRLRKLAGQKGIMIDLPPVFAESSERQCPFAERNALFIDYKGDIMPCYNFAHEHSVMVNQHERKVSPYVLGNVLEWSEKLNENLKSEKIQRLYSVLKNLPSKAPFCGDCIYSTQNCYYVSDNSGDCYGNQPGCNECLYSVGLVKCLFDFNLGKNNEKN